MYYILRDRSVTLLRRIERHHPVFYIISDNLKVGAFRKASI